MAKVVIFFVCGWVCVRAGFFRDGCLHYGHGVRDVCGGSGCAIGFELGCAGVVAVLVVVFVSLTSVSAVSFIASVALAGYLASL